MIFVYLYFSRQFHPQYWERVEREILLEVASASQKKPARLVASSTNAMPARSNPLEPARI
jgi:hypothetical protein